MPLFRFEAINEAGKKYKGTIDADHLQDAKFKLQRKQILATLVEALSDKKLGCRLPKSELLNLTKEIARLLQAGMPLFEVLSALEEKYKGQKTHHRLLLDLCDQVRSGKTLSQALSRHPKTFDLLYLSMIANAEKTGRLKEALQEIASWIGKELNVRKQIISAMLYPSLLGTFCLFVLSSLLFFVVPSMAELFEGRSLHPFTTIVFTASRWACGAKPYLALLALVVIGSIGVALFYKAWQKKILSIAFRLPYIKMLLAKVAFVRFCRSCATLLEGGVPIITALSQARSVMGHPRLEEVIRQAEDRVRQGEKIYGPFLNHPLIPSLIPRMLGIAEEGGKLPFMMRQIAEIYEDELEKTLTYISALAQPILLLILGAMVGFVLLAVLLPLTDVSSFAN